jgi:fatty acid CoA ligase FadD9
MSLGAAHFDGDRCTAVGVYQRGTAFDVMNPHDDGVSLDVFVDWLIEAGHAVHRIDDYAEVFQSAVQTAKIGVDEDIPHLSQDFIGKYISDLRLLNVLTE